MKKFALEFLRRGAIASGIGPVVLAIIYLILEKAEGLSALTVKEVVIGIFSLTALAFISGGMNAIYQIERLPLMTAILIHGGVLYLSYLVTYLVNDWINFGVIPIVIFSAIFVLGYMVIWAIVYSIARKNTKELNEMLKKKQAE